MKYNEGEGATESIVTMIHYSNNMKVISCSLVKILDV